MPRILKMVYSEITKRDAPYSLSLKITMPKWKSLLERVCLATLKNLRTYLKHLKSFLWKTYKKSDINLAKLQPSFLNDFDFYLRTEVQINNNAAVKHTKKSIENFKIVL